MGSVNNNLPWAMKGFSYTFVMYFEEFENCSLCIDKTKQLGGFLLGDIFQITFWGDKMVPNHQFKFFILKILF